MSTSVCETHSCMCILLFPHKNGEKELETLSLSNSISCHIGQIEEGHSNIHFDQFTDFTVFFNGLNIEYMANICQIIVQPYLYGRKIWLLYFIYIHICVRLWLVQHIDCTLGGRNCLRIIQSEKNYHVRTNRFVEVACCEKRSASICSQQAE